MGAAIKNAKEFTLTDWQVATAKLTEEQTGILNGKLVAKVVEAA